MSLCRRQTPFSGRNGFTLVETLTALVVFSAIALAVYGTLLSGMRLDRGTGRDTERYKEALWFFDQLSTDLENAVCLDLSAVDAKRSCFSAETGSLLLVRRTGKGLIAVRYTLGDEPRGLVRRTELGVRSKKNVALTLRQERRDLKVLTREEIDVRRFLRGELTGGEADVFTRYLSPSGLKFSFAFQERELNPELLEWRDHWGANAIPRGVRVSLQLESAAGRRLSFQRDLFLPQGQWGREIGGGGP